MRKLFVLLLSILLFHITQAQTSPVWPMHGLESPDAPDIQLSYVGNAIKIDISNSAISNNYNEMFKLMDTSIHSGNPFFEFQGYLVYQKIDSLVYPIADFFDATKMRFIAQVDIADSIGSLTNHYYDTINNYCDSALIVNANNLGIQHSFIVNNDAFTGSALQIGNTYCYHVFAYAVNTNKTSPLCNGPFSCLISYRNALSSFSSNCITYTPTSVKEVQNKSNVNVYPNPSSNYLLIESDDIISEVTIIDVSGKTLLIENSIKSNKYSLDIQDLSAGIYFAKITTNQGQKTIRFIKQ